MAGGDPGGAFAGVVGVAVEDDAVEDADDDHALAEVGGDLGPGGDSAILESAERMAA